MRLIIEGGLQPEMEGYDTQQKLLEVMEACMQLQQRKGLTYSDAWREQGYMGNVGRVLSKASRLKNMLWRDFEIDSSDESTRETALDMINLLGFFLINKTDENKWGKRG